MIDERRKGRLLALRRADSSAESLSDEALLAACAVGDSRALGALYDRHEPLVRRFLARVSYADAADLADLVQTTFLEIHRSAGRFAARSAARTFILGIAANTARAFVRKEVRRRSFLDGYATRPAAGGAGPFESLERRQMAARLDEELAKLPADLRLAFVLCDLEELPAAEAATILGVRAGTVWWRLHEARKALRAALGTGREP
jgi:RNA polymerase sigma-70 factor (ECF subfamily)